MPTITIPSVNQTRLLSGTMNPIPAQANMMSIARIITRITRLVFVMIKWITRCLHPVIKNSCDDQIAAELTARIAGERYQLELN